MTGTSTIRAVETDLQLEQVRAIATSIGQRS
jgi:hypothetical protein